MPPRKLLLLMKDLQRKKVGIKMRKLQLVYSTSGNPTKSDLEWMRILDKTIQILEEAIAELDEDGYHSEAANPVDVENVDEDNSKSGSELPEERRKKIRKVKKLRTKMTTRLILPIMKPFQVMMISL